MTYTISELGNVESKTYKSLASALRRVAVMVARNERDGESNYIYVRQHCVGHPEDGRAIVEIHAIGRNAEAHTAAVLAAAAAKVPPYSVRKALREATLAVGREACTLCDGDGFDPSYTVSCERCGGSGKEPIEESVRR